MKKKKSWFNKFISNTFGNSALKEKKKAEKVRK